MLGALSRSATSGSEVFIDHHLWEDDRPASRPDDFPVVDLTDALCAIERWKQNELGWHALRQFKDAGIEPAPDWQRRLHEIRRPLRRGYDPDRRQHYWETVPEFDERLMLRSC
jgi:hypothetical protein